MDSLKKFISSFSKQNIDFYWIVLSYRSSKKDKSYFLIFNVIFKILSFPTVLLITEKQDLVVQYFATR